MPSFKCIICNSSLRTRNHKCGEEERLNHIQIIGGGTSWGRPMPLKSDYNEK